MTWEDGFEDMWRDYFIYFFESGKNERDCRWEKYWKYSKRVSEKVGWRELEREEVMATLKKLKGRGLDDIVVILNAAVII